MAKLDFNRMRARTQQATSHLAERDQQLRQEEEPGSLTLDRIGARLYGDTRPLNPAHVIELAQSIQALGLLEPIVVDRKHRLLAGGHRLAACRLLLCKPKARREMAEQLAKAAQKPLSDEARQQLEALGPDDQLKQGVPVRIVSFDSAQDQDRALAIEAAENTQRRDYTRAEIRALYGRLIEAGYTDRRGRPRKGDRQAKPAIAMIIGRSLRTVERMLAEQEADRETQRLVRSLKQARAGLRTIGRAAEGQSPALDRLRGLIDEGDLDRLLTLAIADLDGQ